MLWAPTMSLALLLGACASSFGASAAATMQQTEGDIAVLGLYVEGEPLTETTSVASEVRSQVASLFGERAASSARVRAAIATQLAGAALRASDRIAILEELDRIDSNPEDGLRTLRDHRVATLVDPDLRDRARTLFLRAATEATARGDEAHARELLCELHGWLRHLTEPPGDLEVPRAVRDLFNATRSTDHDAELFEHGLPFLTLFPYGLDHLALQTDVSDRLAPEVVEQAARLGTAMRLDRVVLVSVVEGRGRAFIVDVPTRSLLRDWSLPGAFVDEARSQ
ncbi:MAG: hypothetical protein CSA66_04395 [Proteobacteria bacterium]|nr:MAG: hypothetical protein CSA66_04395 [Pseudomonadota bacterium]